MHNNGLLLLHEPHWRRTALTVPLIHATLHGVCIFSYYQFPRHRTCKQNWMSQGCLQNLIIKKVRTHTCRVESYRKSSCSITSSLGWGTAPWDTPLKLIFHFLHTIPLSVMTIWVKSFEGDGTWPVASNSFFALRISFFKAILFITSSLAWLSRTFWRLLALSAIGEQS